MKNKPRVACLLNTVGSGNIPLENFAAVNGEDIEKYLVVYYQNQEEVETFISETYPKSNFNIYSCSSDSQSKIKKFSRVNHLRKILQSIDPDVVHVHHTGIAVATSILRIFKKFNLLITAHSSFDHFQLPQKAGYTLSFLMADQVICNSNNTCTSLPSFIRKSKKKVIYNGVNFDQIDNESNLNQDSNSKFKIGTACRIIPLKDLDTLIKGFAYFLDKIDSKEAQLRLIGEGFERERLEQMVEKLGISDWVMFTGEVSRQEVYAEMQSFDVFVVSSRWEGFCNAMVEAAASGNPIVASNIEPLPEVIGKDNALFFPVGDEKALGEHLTKLFNNSELRQNLANKGKAYVRSRYSLKKSAETYFETYLNFIN